jgi:hypothetical protein
VLTLTACTGFEQEARRRSAELLAVFDIGQHDSSPFLLSEHLEGESLRAALDRGALPQRKTIEYGVQIAQGLAAAHQTQLQAMGHGISRKKKLWTLARGLEDRFRREAGFCEIVDAILVYV